ncbi:hypothetical protein V8G54_005498 [Vigna mungo]|uniref:HMA domain-containing protein n=1 Tax=Vigna mungo TaxID=3915 RepID=A0AAQ3NX91_VIGMU
MGEEEKKPEEPKVEEKKPEEPEKKQEKKKEETAGEKKPQVVEKEQVTPPPPPPPPEIVLKVFMHCEGCARKVRRSLKGFPGVESADPDLKNSVVSVKGVYDPEKLVEYVYKRTGKHAVIVKLEAEKKEEKKEEKVEEVEKKEEVEKDKTGEGEENKEKKEEEEAKVETKAEEADKVVPDVKINEYFHNPPSYGMEVYAYPAHPVYPAYPAYFHAYPPQIFSDENPNACTVM